MGELTIKKIDKTINELHLYEKKLLKQLDEDPNLTPDEMAEKLDIPSKAVTSAAGMLASKNIINMNKNTTDIINLSDEGLDYAENGLPEHRILKALQEYEKEGIKEVGMDDVIQKAGVTKQQMNFAIGTLMRNHWAHIDKGNLKIEPEAITINITQLPEIQFLHYLKEHPNIADNEIPKEYKKIQKQFSKRKGLFNIKTQ